MPFIVHTRCSCPWNSDPKLYKELRRGGGEKYWGGDGRGITGGLGYNWVVKRHMSPKYYAKIPVGDS